MKIFLQKILLFIVGFIMLIGCILLYQFYYIHKLWSILPEKQTVIRCDIDEKRNSKSINILGCSNLEFGIDINEVRKAYPNVNINKFEFAGLLNNSYLKYIIETMRASGIKDKFILFLPIELYFHQNTFPDNDFFYKYGISKDYLRFLFKENKYIFFSENWRTLYGNCARYNFGKINTIFKTVTNNMDSLVNNKTAYSDCNYPFDRTKHSVMGPDFSSSDASYFNEIFGKDNYQIIETPIPNIPEHMHYDFSNFEKSGFNKPLDPVDSVIIDSSLFYDQWYHLNKCGRIMETNKMIRILPLSNWFK